MRQKRNKKFKIDKGHAPRHSNPYIAHASVSAQEANSSPWRLSSLKSSLIIVTIGFVAFSSGLNNPFMGDDLKQIVENVPVHSISNLWLFFSSSTFYVQGAASPLQGVYYRPLMSTVFSLLYNVFGPQPFYFHVLQLALGVASASILYLVFRYSFNTITSLCLALIFLVHPLNSQVIYAIANMQDVLFFFSQSWRYGSCSNLAQLKAWALSLGVCFCLYCQKKPEYCSLQYARCIFFCSISKDFGRS